MDLVLCGLTYESCLVYLDDIIVFARDFDAHVERLREVFERLQAANLKLHVKKCFLFQKRVAFLGHVLSEAGIEVQQKKVATIREWLALRQLTELRSFLGLCSYYRRFIGGSASICAPLHALLRRDVPFEWMQEHELNERTN
jgi:Reverse transcriptase (RNA-dependent DNA polymerase)